MGRTSKDPATGRSGASLGHGLVGSAGRFLRRLRGSRGRRPVRAAFGRFEPLESRRLLAAATDLTEISGRIFDDFSGNGFDVGEQVAGAAVTLYRDDGDGLFEPGTDDSVVATTTSESDGRYVFPRLVVGDYFVRQPSQTVGGVELREDVSPRLRIDAVSVEGRIVRLIDGFDQTTQSVRDEVMDGVPVTSSVLAVEALGGERDLLVNKTSVNGAVQLSVDDPLLPDLLTFDSIATGVGERRISWDGPDGDAGLIDDAGLDGLDLTTGTTAGLTAAGLRLQVGADLAGGTAIVRIYSDDATPGTANRFSVASIPIPATGGAPSSAEFMAFDDFTAGGSAGADFTNIGAIELEITGAANVNGSAELVGTIGSNVLSANFDNFESSDLELSIDVDDRSPNLNQTVTYTITLRNNGPDSASGIVISESIPTGVVILNPTTSLGTYRNLDRRWTLPSLASGATAMLTIPARIETTGVLTAGTEVIEAGQQDADSTPGNNLLVEDDQAEVSLTTQVIDLALVSEVTDVAPNVGDTVTLTLTLTNAGPDTATGVQIRSPIPDGLTAVGIVPSLGQFQSGVWSVDSIAPGQTATLAVNGRVNRAGMLVYTGEVIAAEQVDIDSSPSNGLAGEDDQTSISLATPVADLSLTHGVSNARPNVGDNVQFTVTVTNNGPDPADNVLATRSSVDGVTLLSAVPSQGTFADNGTWDLGRLEASGTATLVITARIDSAEPASLTAAVTRSAQTDPDSTPGNNLEAEDDQATVVLTPQRVDLSLQIGVDNFRPNRNEEVRLTVELSNLGPDDATGVTVVDVLTATPAAGLVFRESDSAAFNPSTGIWNVGTVAAGTTRTLELVAAFTSDVNVTTAAEVGSADQFDTDSRPGNSVAGEDDEASVTLTPATADIALTKTADTTLPSVGETIVFTVRAQNQGPDAATGVEIRDLLPPELTYVSDTAFPGTSYTPATGIWQIPRLGSSGIDANATLVIRAVANTNGTIANTAELIASDQRDPDSTPNNSVPGEDDQATVTVQAQQVDLSLTHSIDTATPNLGQLVALTVTLRNSGPDVATGIVVRQQLPAGLTLVGSQPTQGSFNTSTGVWNAGALNAGAVATLTVNAGVNRVGQDAVTAEVTAADQFDLDSTPGNGVSGEDDQAVVSYRTTSADLAIDVAVDEPSANIGDLVRITTRLTNGGPDSATGVRVAIPLPPGLQYVSDTLSGGRFSPGTGVWEIDGLATGTTASLVLTARVQDAAEKNVSVEIQAADQVDPDSTPGNGLAAEDDQQAVMIVTPVADLSIDHTVSDVRPAVGQAITFTTVISNAGTSTADQVEAAIALPTDFVIDSVTPAVAFDRSSAVWTVGAVSAGASRTLLITGTVAAPVNQAPTARTSTAEITASAQFDPDSTPGNNLALEDDLDSTGYTPASADLSVTSTLDRTTPNLGSQVRYTVEVRNDGPDSAVVAVDAALPVGVGFVRTERSVGNYNPTTGLWSVGELPGGSTAALQLTIVASSLGPQSFIAQVASSSQLDPDSSPASGINGEDDEATVSLQAQQIDLALVQMLDNASPNVGDTVTQTLQVRNDGPSTATGIAIANRLPGQFQIVTTTPSRGSYQAATGQWTLGALGVGEIATLQVQLIIDRFSDAVISAEVTSADQPDVDSTPANNQSIEDDQAMVVLRLQQADLSVTQTVDNLAPSRDDVVTFRVNLRNDGPDAATNIRLASVLSAGLIFDQAVASTGTFNPTTRIWSIPSLPPGSNAILQVGGRVAQPGALSVTSQIIAADQFDPDSVPGNSVSSEDDQVVSTVDPAVVDLAVTATADNATPIENETIQITAVLTNSGNTAASNVRVDIPLPIDLDLVSFRPQIGTFNPTDRVWSIPALPAGATTQIVLDVNVRSRGFREIPIEVTAADQFDIDSTPGNNLPGEDDSDTLILRAPRVLTKRLLLSR